MGVGGWVDNSYATVGRIPKEWMAGWLAQRLAADCVTSQMLASLEEDDGENSRLLFEAETQLPLGTPCRRPPALTNTPHPSGSPCARMTSAAA